MLTGLTTGHDDRPSLDSDLIQQQQTFTLFHLNTTIPRQATSSRRNPWTLLEQTFGKLDALPVAQPTAQRTHTHCFKILTAIFQVNLG